MALRIATGLNNKMLKYLRHMLRHKIPVFHRLVELSNGENIELGEKVVATLLRLVSGTDTQLDNDVFAILAEIAKKDISKFSNNLVALGSAGGGELVKKAMATLLTFGSGTGTQLNKKALGYLVEIAKKNISMFSNHLATLSNETHRHLGEKAVKKAQPMLQKLKNFWQ